MNTISASINATSTTCSQDDKISAEKKASIRVSHIAKTIDLDNAKISLEKSFFCQKFKDALYVSLPRGHIIIFEYGLCVFWSVHSKKQEELLVSIQACAQGMLMNTKHEVWSYHVRSNEKVGIKDDLICIPDKEILTLLGLSHVLAQSALLDYFEGIAQETIVHHSKLSHTLASTGTIGLSRKALSRERGKLFSTKSDILLHFNLLDTPEFFWHYPEQEYTYLTLGAYLELKPRVELLSMKLSTISELLDMLAAEQHHKHAAFLEWIIIILIAVDIAVYFVGD